VKEADLLNYIKLNPYFLGPMAGITDCAFRSFMRKMGCGVVTTELVSATGLIYNSEKTKKLMSFTEDQSPVGVQIFGYELEHFTYAAKYATDMGADFIDLNFGCPVPKVVKKGGGSAVLKDLVQLRKVLRAVQDGAGIPVTIKIRTGWDEENRNAIDVAQVAYDEGITWVAIHGRTRQKAYKGLADWEFINEVANAAKLPIIGNGDITSAKIANERLNNTACTGVMIARGCLKNPWIFMESQGIEPEKNFTEMFRDLRTFLQEHFNDYITSLQYKKLAAWYSAGYPQSSNFRKSIFQLKEKSEIFTRVEEYFEGIQHIEQEDTSDQPFLMGGHG